MGTLCGIWLWEHCLVYSLAQDLQGRFAKHDTHSEACCFCLSLLPFTDQRPPHPTSCQPKRYLPSHHSISHFKGWDFPKGLHFSDEHDLRLHPSELTSQSLEHLLWGLSRESTLSIWTTRTKDSEGRAVSLPHVTRAGCSYCHRLWPGLSKNSLSPPWTISPIVRPDQGVKLQWPRNCPHRLQGSFSLALASTLLTMSPEPDCT